MRILAIETSCDETAIAILEGQGSRGKEQEKFKILSNVVLSQIKIHKPFGGVVPNLAKREHQKNLPIVLKKALKESQLSPKKIDTIAVTYGPGLEPALWMGINFAKDLAEKWKKPLILVNHLEGHIYASWLRDTNPQIHTNDTNKHSYRVPQFPLLALIVSGGHTELVLMKKHLNYKILGETLDDAAGEAFDKVARLLKLEYPGGPEISKQAEKWKKTKNKDYGLKTKDLFPRPMVNSPNLNFSFSGLKTAVLYYLRNNPNANKTEVAYEFEQAVVDVLVKKTEKAIKKYNPKSLVVGGGVAANNTLRHTLKKLVEKLNSENKHLSPKPPLLTKERGTKGVRSKISLFLSPLWLTGDNAAMIAAAAYFKIKLEKINPVRSSTSNGVRAQGNLRLEQKF